MAGWREPEGQATSAQVSPAQQHPPDEAAGDCSSGPYGSGTQLAQGGGGEGWLGGVRCLFGLGPGAWTALQGPTAPILVPGGMWGWSQLGVPKGDLR